MITNKSTLPIKKETDYSDTTLITLMVTTDLPTDPHDSFKGENDPSSFSITR